MVMAGEMTVDGNLTVVDTLHVTTIQSATIDSLNQEIADLKLIIAQLQDQIAIIDALLNNITGGDCNELDPGLQFADACGVCGGQTFNFYDCGDFALSFNGEDEWIEFYAGIIPSEGDFTVELWTYHNDTNQSHIEILSQGTSGNAFYIGRDENNKFRIGDSWQGTNVYFPFGGYYNITVVKESNNTHLFFDGNLVESKGSAIPNPNEENYFKIGMQYSQGEYWNGYIDEVRISNFARYTSDFIPQDRFESDANTLALWHFDPNPDNLLIDSSPNGNHGTLQNMDGSNWIER